MRSRVLPLMLFALAALTIAAFSGCSSDSGPTAPTGGMLSILLTDAPIDSLAEIHVYIVELKIKRAGSPVERIASEVGSVELLALRDTTELLAAATVEPGDYEFIEVRLDESRSSVVELGSPEALPIKIPSEKIQVRGGFVVDPIGRTDVTLDFDAAQSVHQRGNGEWILNPVIVQLNAERQ